MNIKPIQPKRISDQVFEQIRELIYKGEFKPGQQIPAERELAVSMAISRTSVRNAINKMVAMGLLEHRKGQGTFVSTPETNRGNSLAMAMVTEDATLDDLLEVRMGLECNSDEDPRNLMDVLDHHKALLECIRNRQPEKAHETMRQHILYVQDYFHRR